MDWLYMVIHILFCIIFACATGRCFFRKIHYRKLYTDLINSLQNNTIENEITIQIKKEIDKKHTSNTRYLLISMTGMQEIGVSEVDEQTQFIQYLIESNYKWLIRLSISLSSLILQIVAAICYIGNLLCFSDMLSLYLAGSAIIAAIVIAVEQYSVASVEQKRASMESEKLQVQKNAEIVFREQQIASIVLENTLMQFTKIFDSICVDAQVRQRQCTTVINTDCISLYDCDSVIVKLQSSVGGLSCYDWTNAEITINKLSCHIISVTDTVCVLCITEERTNTDVIDLLKQFSLRNNNPISITCIFDGLCVKAAEKAKNLFNPDDIKHVRYWEVGFSCIYTANALHIAGDNNIKALLNFNEIQFLG